MQQKCTEGAQIGRELCKQDTNEGPSIVPLDIIDHFDSVRSEHSVLGKEWNRWTQSICDKDPKPAWTGFEDCYHGCQYMYADCKQTHSCKVCFDEAEFSSGRCDGIRDKVVYAQGSRVLMDWNVPPPEKYTFLDACVKGCSVYVSLKKEKGGGPACKKGRVKTMMRTLIAEEFTERCTESGGFEDGQVCVCDREQGSECIGRDGKHSSYSYPAQGCLNDGNVDKSGFMNGCEECKCSKPK